MEFTTGIISTLQRLLFPFRGDSVPQHVQQWNVEKVELDKNKRFKDVEVVRYFWHSLEKELISRGYR